MTYINESRYAVLLKGSLKHLVVVRELIVNLCLPVYLAHLHCARVDSINDLAVDSASGALLDLLNVQLKAEETNDT
jgi:hypothetical protein